VEVAAYFVADVDIRDPEKFEDYRTKVPALVERYGGRYLVRGGELHPVEGDPGVKRLVIIEFPSVEAARRFNTSAEYVPLLRLRRESAASEIVPVEGWTPLG
jgi:uncharacterized protein (DUF1330 family)